MSEGPGILCPLPNQAECYKTADYGRYGRRTADTYALIPASDRLQKKKIMRLLALLLCSAALASPTEPPKCKLSPFDKAWPIDAEWAALNESISGSLIKTRPAASSCYKTNPFDSPLKCNVVEANWTQSMFHANLPESISSALYANNSCIPPGAQGYSKTVGCHLGGYPSYVVNATSDEQIALAVKWASERNIRIVVKGTGHDLCGRFVFRCRHEAFGSC